MSLSLVERLRIIAALAVLLQINEIQSEQELNVTCHAILTEASRYPPDHAIATPCCGGRGVQYHCINGYRLIRGDGILRCKGGTMEGEEPVCEFPEVTSCGNPGPINNGYFIGSHFRTGQNVTYMCYPGFRLVGHATRECLHNAMWSEPPRCVLVGELNLDLDNAANVVSENMLHEMYKPRCAEPGASCKVTSPSRKRRALQVDYLGGLDLVFLFDASDALEREKFGVGLRFAQELVRILDATIGRGQLKIAAITYATSIKINFHLSSASERFLKKIWSIKKQGGCGSNLGKALYLIRRKVVPTMRRESKKALFLITNGRLIMGSSHKKAARLLKTENHFDVFAVSVGKGPNKNELQALVSQPIKDHVITLKHFSDVFGGVRKAISASKTSHSQCGISGTKTKTRTVRGNKAASGVWPWQIGIFWDRGRSPICGGALIGDQWVLTAAHCFYSSAKKAITWPPWRYTIVAGDHKTIERSTYKQMVPVAKIYVHRDYKYRTHQSDIALVKLQYKFKLNKYIRPVCLPEATKGRIRPSTTGKRGFLAAWDVPNQRKSRSFTRRKSRSRVTIHTALVISSESQCKNATKKPFNASYMFCANDGKGYKHNCRGDGGSPFVSEKYDQGSRGYRWTVNGLVSWDEKCGSSDHYAFFTRVSPFVDWANRLMRDTRSRRRH